MPTYVTAWPSIKGQSETRGGSAVIIRNSAYRVISLSVYPIVALRLSRFLALGGEIPGQGLRGKNHLISGEGVEGSGGIHRCRLATAKGARLAAAMDIDLVRKWLYGVFICTG